jgi:hypothetical protein
MACNDYVANTVSGDNVANCAHSLPTLLQNNAGIKLNKAEA